MKSHVFLTAAIVLGVFGGACKKEDASNEPGVAASASSIPAIVAPPVVFAADVGAPKVQEECDLQNSLPTFVNEYAPSVMPGVPGAGPVLQMEVVGLMGTGGGMYTGPKQLTVRGALTEGGQVLGSFTAQRTTTGGAFGGYKGTCSLLGRCAKAIAKDVSEWLASPTMDARLGEL